MDNILMGAPIWAWTLFAVIVIGLMVFDLGLLNKKNEEISIKKSIKLTIFYIGVALAFGVWVGYEFGREKAIEYYTGFFVEKSLSIDNVFVFALIFTFLGIPLKNQYRVLVWGILVALLLRGLFIGMGSAIVSQWSWVLWFFGGFLIITGLKMLFVKEGETDLNKNPALIWMRKHLNISSDLRGDLFWFKENGERVFTPLFVALILVNVADVIFAVDSVPAILAITQDPFIVYTSNIFAILGLRALYFALAAMINRFHYLKYALALILVLIGFKIVLMMMGIKIEALVTLCATFALLAGGVLFSLWKTRMHDSSVIE
jgi:tellurite resistance protein TerC